MKNRTGKQGQKDDSGLRISIPSLLHGFRKIAALRYSYGTEEASSARRDGKVLSRKISDEGIVLLRNEGSALPLTDRKINVFGADAYNFRVGGSGSGSVDASDAVGFFDALSASGFEINPELHRMYLDMGVVRREGSSLLATVKAFIFGFKKRDEPDPSYLSEEVMEKAHGYSRRALIVLSNSAVESADTDLDALRVTDNRRALMEKVCGAFEHVTVIINSGNVMELGILDEFGSIDSVLWVGMPGPYGCLSLGDVLTGKINPSGRLTDTWAYDISGSPASVNFTTDSKEYRYDNCSRSFLNYEEGIYVGYRYYETRFSESEDEYRAAVQYPFGYGLSYTAFSWETESFETGTDAVRWAVRVVNTGKTAGKDVVELYVTAPYMEGGIEKSAVTLAAFAKTRELGPGETQSIVLEVPVRDIASYDMENGCYTLDEGTYVFRLGRSVHDIAENREFSVPAGVMYETDGKTGRHIENRFSFANGGLTYLSRSDWEGTWPGNGKNRRHLGGDVLSAIEHYRTVAPSDKPEPMTGAENGIVFGDLRGLPFSDPKWEAFLDQFTFDELNNLVSWAGWHTEAVERLGVPETKMLDGPAGLNSMYTKLEAAAYPAESMVAATWNTDLAYSLGEAVGREARGNGIAVWYAPALNLHRTPQGGRNFEYYSEDPVLSGRIGAATVRGAQDQGVAVTVKHFVLNNEETGARSGLYVWINEQTLRELYLRPFEIAVKEGGAHGAMSAFTHVGYEWSGACAPLLQDVLRGEWGFEGFVTTDAQIGGFMNGSLGIRRGNDLMLTMGLVNDEKVIRKARETDPAGTLLALRECVHRALYTLLNFTSVQE